MHESEIVCKNENTRMKEKTRYRKMGGRVDQTWLRKSLFLLQRTYKRLILKKKSPNHVKNGNLLNVFLIHKAFIHFVLNIKFLA